MPTDHGRRITELEIEIAHLKKTLGTLISWIAQSANSPIRISEADTLINMMGGIE